MKKPIALSALAAALALAGGCMVSEPLDPGPDDVADDEPAPTDEPTDDPTEPTDDGHDPTPLESGLDLAGIDGNLRLYLTDAPAAFDEVWVEVSSVEISRDDSWHVVTDQPMALDLLSLQNDVTAVLGDANLEAGHYGQIRFMVASAQAIGGGESSELTIPSGAQTGIKINLDLTVEPDKTYAVVLDFDALASIREAGPKLIMSPVIKLEYIGEVTGDEVDPMVDNGGDPDPTDPGDESADPDPTDPGDESDGGTATEG